MIINPAPDQYPTNPEEDFELLTAKEAARILKVNESTIYRKIQEGEIGSVRFGRSVRVRRSDLTKFIECHSNHI